MELVGPAICISGAVYQDFISIDPLTPMYYLFLLPHNPLMTHLARVFKALKMGLAELKDYYESVLPTTTQQKPSLSNSLCFPYLSSFVTSTQRFHFIYTGKVPHGNGRVFEGKVVSVEDLPPTEQELKLNTPPSVVGTGLIIKFVRRYGVSGHLLLSSHSPPLAPALYCVAPVGAGWLMVVMEKVVNPQPLPSIPSSILCKSLLAAVSRLHSQNLVHGDLRSNNMLVSEDGARAYLIDFDWCGKENEDVYPNFMNGVDISWPHGASDGRKLKRKHDDEMMSRLLQQGIVLEEEKKLLELDALSSQVSSIALQP
jgi:serine/threonine protein kinase